MTGFERLGDSIYICGDDGYFWSLVICDINYYVRLAFYINYMALVGANLHFRILAFIH